MTKQKLLLVKVGGKVVENPVALNQLISDLSKPTRFSAARLVLASSTPFSAFLNIL